MKRLLVIGASGHGKVIADIAELNGYDNIVFLDDNAGIKCCGRHQIVGKSRDTAEFASLGYDVFIAVGDGRIRQGIQERLERENIEPVILIHPSSIIASDVKIGNGSVVMAGAVINSGSCIGKGCIVNTCASVDHDSIMGDFVHVSVGAHVAGNVCVEHGTWIGIGAVVSNNIYICANCMIGAGAVVVKDIKDAGTYAGVPARKKR